MSKSSSYIASVARLGCAICVQLGYPDTPAEVHHARTGVGAGRRAPDDMVIPLCPEHHRGNTGLHGMGRKAFERKYRVTELDLVDETRARVAELRSLGVW